METFSALLAICAGNSPVTGEFPAQRPVTRSFDVFYDLRLNKRLSRQSWGWWAETLSRPLWRHCNGGPGLNIQTIFPGIRIRITKIRQSWDRVIYMYLYNGNRYTLYIQTALRIHEDCYRDITPAKEHTENHVYLCVFFKTTHWQGMLFFIFLFNYLSMIFSPVMYCRFSLLPGARPTKHISIEFEIRWKFKTL